MKKTVFVLTLALAFTLLFAAVPAQAERYLWTLSASSTDPFVNTGAPGPGGIFELHLWLACSAEGMSAASFMVEGSVGLLVLAWNPCCGFLLHGPSECLLLAVGGCPSGPIRAGWFLVFDPGIGGRVCMIDCPVDEGNYTIDCDPQQPEAHPNAWIGFASDGMPPCGSGTCGPIAVEANSWGRIKGFYH
jgi:hypothetical protein